MEATDATTSEPPQNAMDLPDDLISHLRSCRVLVLQQVQLRGGKPKLRIRSPPRRPRSPPPEATATNSSPFTTYTDGDENTPAPVLNFHSGVPVFASNA